MARTIHKMLTSHVLSQTLGAVIRRRTATKAKLTPFKRLFDTIWFRGWRFRPLSTRIIEVTR